MPFYSPSGRGCREAAGEGSGRRNIGNGAGVAPLTLRYALGLRLPLPKERSSDAQTWVVERALAINPAT